MSDIEIRTRDKDGARILDVNGQLDSHTAYRLEEQIQASIAAGQPRLVVNLRQVEYLSSAGMGAMLKYLNVARSANGDIKLSNLPDRIDALMRSVGLAAALEIYQFEEEALARF
ncbi:MAG: STAS domain-containing protein [Leptospiraceae bacterium]|nr:STAS domain-containing protein [Leptospiraceae bacterium]MCB1316105.1 STAS domain-containing protein [Leptospiraceae bacterium]